LSDDVVLAPAEFATGRLAALRHMQTLAPSDRAAIYSASGNVTLGFTDNRELLRNTLLGMASLNRPQTWVENTLRCRPMTFYRADLIVAGDPGAMKDCAGGGSSNPIAEGARIVREAVVMADAESVVQRSDRDLLTYFGALETLVNKMAELPGERVIVLLSPGIYVPPRFKETQNAIIARTIRAKVVISGVDVRGVYMDAPDPGLDPTTPPLPIRYRLGESIERTGFMEDLTTGTGGLFLRGNNDLDLQLRRAASAPEYVYVLSFAPADQRLDDKRHTIRVTLKNPQGFTLQARNSYVAANGSGDPADPVKQQIEEAFFSSRELKDLPVQLQTQFFREDDNATLTVTARVDATKLPFRKENGRNRDDLTLVVGLFDQNGNYVAAYQKVIEMRLKDESLAGWLKSGIETATDFTVKPGRYLVRLVVRDSESQAMAEQSTGVEIPW
jgi:VWFA-related protein